MGIVQTFLRVKRLLTQGIGVVVGLVGLLFISASVPPQDAEAGLILLIGIIILLMGVGIVTNPEKVRFGSKRRGRPHDDDRNRDRRWK